MPQDGERVGLYHSFSSSFYGQASLLPFLYGEGKDQFPKNDQVPTDIFYREQKKEDQIASQESSDEERDTVVVDGTPALKN